MMHLKRNTLIVYSVFLVFMLVLIATSFYFESIVSGGKYDKMFELAKNASLFKYGSFFGLVLLIVDFVIHVITVRNLVKEKETMQLEMNTLKAKLFDLQEAEKTVVENQKKEQQ